MPIIGGAEGFTDHYDDLKLEVDSNASEADQRAAKVKNISLRLLGIESARGILDLFEEEFVVASREGGTTDGVGSIEELFMFLYFFKTQLSNMSDA